MLLVKSQQLDKSINLDELMMYPLTPVPHSLGTPDGFFNKTNKASILHFVTDDVTDDVPYPTNETLYIQDGNAQIHALINLLSTLGQICLKLLDQMSSKSHFIFSTDSYHVDSIKGQERLRRGNGDKFIVDGPATRKPADFKLFLANDDKKWQLFKLLLCVWQSDGAASSLEKCGRAGLAVDGKAYHITLSNGNVSILTIVLPTSTHLVSGTLSKTI